MGRVRYLEKEKPFKGKVKVLKKPPKGKVKKKPEKKSLWSFSFGKGDGKKIIGVKKK